MKIINNNPAGYAELRNIIVFGTENVKYADDIFSLGNKLKHKLTGKAYNIFYKGLFYSIKDSHTPAHLFNSINLGKNPWIVTFETVLPRLGNAGRFWNNLAIKQLTKPNCKKIIALSQCTFNRQIAYMENLFPQYCEAIRKKMIVMHPPQPLLVNSYDQKKISFDDIVFTIVGADFFRKGGREILNVFNKLIPQFPELKLNIVSALNFGDYASRTTLQDYQSAMRIIEKFPENIFYFRSLSNDKVLELLKASSVGLLPSWGDTYGYSVLEAQAAGCPVITTNIRAFPEINDNDCGWVIKVPVNSDFDADIDTEEKRSVFGQVLENALYDIILQILHSPHVIREKGIGSLDRIRLQHSPQDYKLRLNELYDMNFKSFSE